jgi:hypothetical protein
MPGYRVLIKGREVFAETLDDLDALLERYPGSSGSDANHDERNSSQRSKGGQDGRWPASRFKDFISRLSAPQVRMLQELVKSPHGRTAQDLASILGFRDAKVFGPVLAAMSKHAKKTGVRIQDVLTTDRIDLGDNEKVTEFKATESFAKIAGEAGWSRGT